MLPWVSQSPSVVPLGVSGGPRRCRAGFRPWRIGLIVRASHDLEGLVAGCVNLAEQLVQPLGLAASWQTLPQQFVDHSVQNGKRVCRTSLWSSRVAQTAGMQPLSWLPLILTCLMYSQLA